MKISLVCMPATMTPARKMPGPVAFERLGIGARPLRFRIQPDAERRQEFQVGPVAGHGEDEIVLQRDGAFRRFEHHRLRLDLDNAAS